MKARREKAGMSGELQHTVHISAGARMLSNHPILLHHEAEPRENAVIVESVTVTAPS
jgi:hypothetical protein